MRALVDDHVIAASQPMEIAASRERGIRYLSGGVMMAPGGIGDMRRYTVWSYAPAPSPASLVAPLPRTRGRSRATSTSAAPSCRPTAPPDARTAVSGIFADDLYQQLWAYEPMWREASRLTAKARSPYEATITIERWLRSAGGFGYDEHPPAAVGAPPLVDFLERSKLGYCQQFAGTMALMLRYLGIPARVAVGFTSGTWKDGTWTVTDHDAHAWVEAWFAGHGWLTFDPTPGRGTLSATYTNASDSADAIRALGTGRFLGAGSFAPTTPRRGVATPEVAASTGVPWRLIVPLGAGRGRCSSVSRSLKSGARWRRARTTTRGAVRRRRGQSWRPSSATRARRCRRRPRSTSSRSSCAAAASEPMRSPPPSRVRATGRRRALRSLQTRRAGSWGGSSRCCGRGSGREEDPWLPHGALAARRRVGSGTIER